MSDLHPTNDNLFAFVSKFLSEEKAKELKAHLRNCPMCDEALLAVTNDRDRLLPSPPPRYVNGRYVDARISPLHNFMRSKRLVTLTGIAVASLLIAILVPRIGAPPEELYWMPIALTASQFRGVSAPEAMVYQEALDAYADRDAEQVLVFLEGVDVVEGSQDGLAIVAQLLKASALLNSDESYRALAVLAPIEIRLLPAPWRSRAGWLRYLALRETKQNTAACSLLEWLADEQGEIAARVRSEFKVGPCRFETNAGSRSG